MPKCDYCSMPVDPRGFRKHVEKHKRQGDKPVVSTFPIVELSTGDQRITQMLQDIRQRRSEIDSRLKELKALQEEDSKLSHIEATMEAQLDPHQSRMISTA